MVQSFITDKLEAIAELCRTHHVKRLAVFGSAARDDFDPERSDVDLLVEFGGQAAERSFENYLELEGGLQAVLGRTVDLVMEGAVRNARLRQLIAEEEQGLYAA